MNKERLLKMAEHLEHGQLHHDAWCFNTFDATCGSAENARKDFKAKVPDDFCGSIGCAIWEIPFVFPELAEHQNDRASDYFRMLGEGRTVSISPNGVTTPGILRSFEVATEIIFDLTYNEVIRLFYPKSNASEEWNNQLSGDATRLEVAAHIRAFIKEQEEIRGIQS